MEVSNNNNDKKEKARQYLLQQLAKSHAETERAVREKEAVIAEYVLADDEKLVELTRNNIRERMPKALEVIDHLLEYGADGIKANLAKYLITNGLSENKMDPVDASMKRMLSGLMED